MAPNIAAMHAECDYVVVGAGTAGCVIAARLSEDAGSRVVVLEAGPNDNLFWIKTPLGYGMLFDDARVNWLYESAPEPGLNDATMFLPRGKVIGGTSSIHGLVYVRGQRGDYDEWAALGNKGWGYDDVLPYFLKSEDNVRGSSAYHSVGGPIAISDIPRNELADAFIEAGVEAGYRKTDDFNGESQEGFGYNQLTIRNGRRCSAADGYLKPALRRPNLELIMRAQVGRILFEGKRAVGVVYSVDEQQFTVRARREVIVCGGSFASPQLLQVSGIGDPAHLASIGVAPVVKSPEVGLGLQDHVTCWQTYSCRKPVTINDLYNSPIRRYLMGIQYVLTGTGLMATNASFCGGYVCSGPQVDRPDIKFNFALWARAVAGRSKEKLGLLPHSGFTASFVLLRPESRGTVLARSSDTTVQPEIRFNLLVPEVDCRAAVDSVREIRRVMSMPAMRPYLGEEIAPGESVTSDDDILANCRKRSRTNNHASGTCRMGNDDTAVVDDQLRVRGVQGLRVIDASIMPRLVSGNTAAAVLMIAEKGAALISDARQERLAA